MPKVSVSSETPLVTKTFSASQIKQELKRENYKSKYLKILKSTIYSLFIIAAFSVLLATLVMPVFDIKGNSMAPTYNNGDIALAIKTKDLQYGDIISFYYGNKILVKRVIARAGDWVLVNEDGTVYVNKELVSGEKNTDKLIDVGDIKYPYQVPDGQWFVLSDDRKDLKDSRSSTIGCIKQEDVIGKVLFKIWPL